MGYVINVKNAKYAPVTTDTEFEYALGDVVNLPGLQQLDITLTTAVGELYGEGALVSKVSKITGAQVKISLAKLSTAARAAITGASISADGVLSVKTSDTVPKIALYAETEEDDGKKEQMWFLVGKAEPAGKSATQSTGNITYSVDELTINFVRRETDKTVYQLIDTSDAAVTDSKSTAFAVKPD